MRKTMSFFSLFRVISFSELDSISLLVTTVLKNMYFYSTPV